MTNIPVSADALLEACAVGNLDSVRKLLEDDAYTAKALETQEIVTDEHLQLKRSRLNLSLMFDKAAGAGSADTVKFLLSFGATHGISHEALIKRDSICFAIYSSNNVAVFQELFAVDPDVIDKRMGHVGTPLTQAIPGSRNSPQYSCDRASLVRYLLEKGADPNRMCGPPASHLYAAVAHSSLEVIRLLIDHGAHIKQSGAIHEAAKRGRIDVLSLLLDHGADVNEQLSENDPMGSSGSRTKSKKEYGITGAGTGKCDHETPLHFSVLYHQTDATAWLVARGADANIEDSEGWSARAMAVKIGDASIVDVLGEA